MCGRVVWDGMGRVVGRLVDRPGELQGKGGQRRWLWEQDTMESQRRGTTFSSVGVAGVLSYDPQVTLRWTSADNEHTSARAGHAL